MSTPIFYPICGSCLHAHSSHEKVNDIFMYCANCQGVCEIIEFNKKHKSDKIAMYNIQAKRSDM